MFHSDIAGWEPFTNKSQLQKDYLTRNKSDLRSRHDFGDLFYSITCREYSANKYSHCDINNFESRIALFR